MMLLTIIAAPTNPRPARQSPVMYQPKPKLLMDIHIRNVMSLTIPRLVVSRYFIDHHFLYFIMPYWARMYAVSCLYMVPGEISLGVK